MKSIVVLFAVIAQYSCMLVATAEYGLKAGLIVLSVILASAIQAVLTEKK